MSGETLRPTKAERLMIWRVRQGLTQRQAAQHCKMTLGRYGLAERGKLEPSELPEHNVGMLRANERCLLQRRRLGWTQGRVAKEMSVSRYWLCLMEQGRVDCTALCNYWDAWGDTT
jgi:transcriptional regulator with XRE-family HTH domain